MDEITLHAPALKVFVYEGHAKLTVPVTKYETQEQMRRRTGRDVPIRTRKSTGDVYEINSIPMKAVDSEEEEEEEEEETVVDWATFVNDFDVCITTYDLRQPSVSNPPLTLA